ncbi:MAG: type II toxin-antitoxin system VapC family toxin, partial [Candidatus Margulisiibacteriota bacterium]
MKLLLDTHILLWSLFEHQKLKQRVQETILNPANSIFVSTLSIWEISMKISLGKLLIKNIDPEDLFN